MFFDLAKITIFTGTECNDYKTYSKEKNKEKKVLKENIWSDFGPETIIIAKSMIPSIISQNSKSQEKIYKSNKWKIKERE